MRKQRRHYHCCAACVRPLAPRPPPANPATPRLPLNPCARPFLRRARAATAAAVAAAGNGGRDKLQEAADALAAIRDQVAYCDVVAAARAVLALRLGAAADALALVAPHPEVPPAERAAPWRLWLVAQARFFKGDLQVRLAGGVMDAMGT